MNGVLEFFTSVVDRDDTTSVWNYLQSCAELRCFYNNKDAVPQVINVINKLLNGGKTREKGLTFLEILLPQCSMTDISANIVSWMLQSLKAANDKEHHNIHTHALDIFCSLLESSTQLPEIKSQIVTTVMPKFIDIALHKLEIEPKKSTVLLKCLEKCFIHYGKSCGNYKNMLQTHILKLLECGSYSSILVEYASRCYMYLSLTGPPGPNMNNYKAAWSNQQSFLIDSMHSLLNILFDNVNEMQSSYKRNGTNTQSCNKIAKIVDKDPLNKAQQLTNKFTGMARYMICMLKLSSPAVKVVDTDGILSVVCRALAVTCTTLQRRVSAETLALITQIPTLHVWCIQMLEAMIQCCHVRAVKHSTIICKLLTQSLKWTAEEGGYGQDKPYGSIREYTYNCLTTWLTIARTGSGIENYVNDIKSGIISDISPSKPVVTLTLDKNMKGKGKIGKRQRNNLLKEGKQQPKCLINKYANKNVCTAALKSLSFIFDSASTLLKAKFHKEMQDIIIKQLLNLQLSYVTNIPIPYSDDECRLAIYTALHSINNNFHAQCPAPFHLSLNIFNKGLKDPSLKVVQFCSLALRSLSNFLCPISPGMILPTNINEKLQDDSLDTRYTSVLFNKKHTENHINEINAEETAKRVDISMDTNDDNVKVDDLDGDNDNILNVKGTKKHQQTTIENVIPNKKSLANRALVQNENKTTPPLIQEHVEEESENGLVTEKDIASLPNEKSSDVRTHANALATQEKSDVTVPSNEITLSESVDETNGQKNSREINEEHCDEAPRKKFKSHINSDVPVENASSSNFKEEEEEMLMSFVDEIQKINVF